MGSGTSKFVPGYVILRDCRDLNLGAIDEFRNVHRRANQRGTVLTSAMAKIIR